MFVNFNDEKKVFKKQKTKEKKKSMINWVIMKKNS